MAGMIGHLEYFPRGRMHLLLATVLFVFAGFVDAASLVETERPEVSSYDTKAHKDSSAVVLRQEQRIKVDESGRSERLTYVAILLNDDAAIQDYSQMEIRHNSYASDVTISFARVFNGDEVKYLSDDAITRQNMSTEDFLFDNERLLFSLPVLRKGAVIEIEYIEKNKRAITPGQFSDHMNYYWWEGKAGNGGGRLDPVLNSILSITYPLSMGMRYMQSSSIGVKPTLTEVSGFATLEWQNSDLEELKPEDWMPEDINLYPLVYVSSFDSWKDINMWAHQLFDSHVSLDEQIAAVARQLESGASTELEKIKAVFDYMEKNIRYVYAHVGRNGYEPHDAQEVLANGYGDCKDQTVLSVSILRSMGIDAYPALISDRGQKLTQDMARNYFDHMFVHIPATSVRPALWMDPTGSKLDFPGIHWRHEGKPALVINGSDDQLTEVKLDSETRDAVRVALSFALVKASDVEIHLNVIYSGLLGQNIASALHFASDTDKLVKDMLRPLYSQATLIEASHRKVENNKDTYELSATFVLKGQWKGAPAPFSVGTGLAQFVGLVYNLEAITEPNKRTQPLQTPKPFELIVSMTALPPAENYAPLAVTKGSDYESKYFDVKQTSRVNEKNEFIVEAALTSKELVVPLSEYESYYRATRNILEMPNWLISYQYDKKAAELSRIAQESESADVGELLKNAEIYLNNGAFSDALILADKAVRLDAGNAKAHYLRGVALGYQQQFEESNQAFSKALELGYEL
jgi:hypothetical protein